MQQTSRAKINILPFILILLVNIVAIAFLKGKGVFFIAIFFNPIFNFINQLFIKYTIKGDSIRIKELFNTTEIPIDSIRQVEKRKSKFVHKYFMSYPDVYQVIFYNRYDEQHIIPRKELVFNEVSQQLYFKN